MCDINKEIGGYIELETNYGKEYFPNAIALNCGRNALRYILRAKNIKKIYIPYFLCSSVSHACEIEKVDYEYYHIDSSFRPLFNKKIADDEYLYVVNYYGQLSDSDLEALKLKHKNLIADYAQSFFQQPIKGIDTLYSCRKYFGVADGAYLFTDIILNEKLQIDESFERMTFLMGRFERTAGEFYQEYVKNNKFFINEPIKLMSRLTQNFLKGLDYGLICKKRTDNFQFLHKHLGEINKLNLNFPEGAFMYPLYVDNGKELRKKLIERKIFISMLWPDVLELCKEHEIEYLFTENILPLPCDQRYDYDDMKYIIEMIKREMRDS